MDSTPVTMDEMVAKLLKDKDLAKVDVLAIRAHVAWSNISYKGLYEVVLCEMLETGKCNPDKGLCFGDYDGVPFFAAMYKSDNGINGVVVTASTKAGVVRIGYGVLVNGRVQPVKSTSDIPWEGLPEPYKGIRSHLKALTDNALQQRRELITTESAKVATDKVITLRLATEKAEKAEEKANLALEKLNKAKAEAQADAKAKVKGGKK